MKLVIASDIHGSAVWCRKLVDAVERECPDRLLLLGDELYHGPRNELPEGYDPKRVIEMLNVLAGRIVAVRGNCDAEVDQMVLDFPCMADYIELFDGPRRLFCTHGHIYSADGQGGIPVPHLVDGDVFLQGHTHVKRDELVPLPDGGTVRVVNPGSVSIPKDGSHSFAVYEDGAFRLEVLE